MHNKYRHRSSDDPLKEAREHAPEFNRAWLKHGESMPLVQRIGFTVISLFSCLVGFYMFADSVLRLRSGDVSFIFSGLFAIVCLFFAYKGLKNVLRFKRKGDEFNEGE